MYCVHICFQRLNYCSKLQLEGVEFRLFILYIWLGTVLGLALFGLYYVAFERACIWSPILS